MQTQYDAVVIGAGSGGLTAAIGLKKAGKSVFLIEREHIGGECTNSGCVPSKALLHHAKSYHGAQAITGKTEQGEAYRREALAYVRTKINEVLAEESPETLAEHGIDFVSGEAEFTAPCLVRVSETEYRYKKAVIATGSGPRRLDIEGLSEEDTLTNQNVFTLEEAPERLLVIGSGPIGLELGQAFALLGSQVTIATIDDRVARLEDPALSPIITKRMEDQGVRFLKNAFIDRVEHKEALFSLKEGAEVTGTERIGFDKVLIAVGRVPHLPAGLEAAGIASTQHGITIDERHRSTNADMTLSVVPVTEKVAPSFGLMKIDNAGRVIDFSEKPKGDALKQMQVDTSTLGLTPEQAKENPYIASMGIYVFKKDVLIDLLRNNPEQTDFGKEIIPHSAKDYNVQAYLFDGYWEDIGTIEAFYHANLALTMQPQPAFSFYQENAPIYTRSRYLPPSKLLDCQVTESIIGDGSILKTCRVSHSVIGLRQRIQENCVIEDALLMGADFYEPLSESSRHLTRGKIPIGIGEGSIVRKAIIDKNARIGRNVQIVNKEGIEESEREDLGFYIRSGIVVILKNAVIPDGMVI